MTEIFSRRHSRLAGALLCAGAFIGGLAVGTSALAAESTQQDAEFSKANQLMFMSDQMSNIDAPATLDYEYKQAGMSDNFSDHIKLNVHNEGDDHGKRVHVKFLSGERSRHVPEIGHATGNPVIKIFLQHDVMNMAQTTGGSWRYFQKHVKMALEHAAKVEDAQVTYNGRTVDAKRITLMPFAAPEQQHKQDIGSALQKRYVITLSDAVPGRVLEMYTETPGPKDSTMTERLSLESVKHDTTSAANVAHDTASS